MSNAKQHAEWLSLLEISGPFLSLNELMRVFPQGVDKANNEATMAADLRSAYAEWGDTKRDPAYHRAWVRYVLESVLGWDERVLAEGQSIPEALHYTASEHGGETIRPSYVLHQPDAPTQPELLVMVTPPDQALERNLAKSNWAASPAMRLVSLLKTTGIRLGLVTNGEHWMLVNAPSDGLAGYISWFAELWQDERLTLRAFISLLEARRFFGVADADTLAAMLTASANDAQEVTDKLGQQVRHALEILVRAFDRLNKDSDGALLADMTSAQLYEGCLTVMMRLVFLLSAEERGLFLLGEALYDNNYAVSTLLGQLENSSDHSTEDVLERRSDAWSRLLATFRLVYNGSTHEDMQLPGYGGSLFDPDRFPFLEGRSIGTPPAINNRTVLHLLQALQRLGTGGEARRLSFRSLDIEQIGHVYEGLLDHEARYATEVMLAFEGKLEPEIALSVIESQAAKNTLYAFLKEQTGRGESALKNTLNRPPDGERLSRLRKVCGDEALFNRALPYLNILRDDDSEFPLVIHPDSFYVTAGAGRRATGTHYTPKSLTEPIVERTLEPLVYVGVAEGLPREDWRLKSPTELLDLKICDMAMGSGAFLVQVCRYLGGRLVEAWQRALSAQTGVPKLTILGTPPTGALGETLIPDDELERVTVAQRLIADRCLYGVDKNPLAVEMGKLSLWLTTLAKGRPFTFLDHALKCGDSLAGVSLKQLRAWDMGATGADKVTLQLFNTRMRVQIDEVVALRRKLESFSVNSVDDQREKTRLFFEAEAKSHDLRHAATLLLSTVLNDDKPPAQKAMRGHLLEVVQGGKDVPAGYSGVIGAVAGLPPFHWELEFPEVFSGRGGFDAFVGNPPFAGGQKITGTAGKPYRDYLIKSVANGVNGSADLVAYFFLRAFGLLRDGGMMGLIATNTIAQGDTREVGLDQLAGDILHGTITAATPTMEWPGAAGVHVAVVHVRRGGWRAPFILNRKQVAGITPQLDVVGGVSGNPNVLAANSGKSFQGSIVLGMGFVLTPEQAEDLIQRDPRNREVLFPYLNGEDLNTHPEQQPSRWVINFFDWPMERAMTYPEPFEIVERLVRPEREKNNRATRRDRWWQYAERATALYAAIAPLSRVLVAVQTSKYLSISFQPKGIVYSHMTVVFALGSNSAFALLNTSLDAIWVAQYASTLETRLRYIPTDCFETFPFPQRLDGLDDIGERYHTARAGIMKSRWEGLTATYNRFHHPQESSADVAGLRALHVEMDNAVAAAYGWGDLDLGHGFHETAQGKRYTLHPAVRREVLQRLLALNFERYAAEVSQGLHMGKKSAGKGKSKPVDAPSDEESPSQKTLI